MSRKCTLHKDVVRLQFEVVLRKKRGHWAAAASGPLKFSEALAHHAAGTCLMPLLQPHKYCFFLLHHLELHHFKDTIGTCAYELLSRDNNNREGKAQPLFLRSSLSHSAL